MPSGVEKTYDIFEIMPDGSPMWRCCVEGRNAAFEKLEALAKKCTNKLRAVDLATGEAFAVADPTKGVVNVGAEDALSGYWGKTVGKNSRKNPEPEESQTKQLEASASLPQDVVNRGEQALVNCHEMRAVNAKMLNQNKMLMTTLHPQNAENDSKAKRATPKHDEK